MFFSGCGALAIGRVDNMYQMWGLLVLAGLGIGGIVVPASIITTIICPDVSIDPWSHEVGQSLTSLGSHCYYLCSHSIHSCRGWRYWLHHILQRLHLQVCP